MKVIFRQLGFDEERPEFQVDLGAIASAAMKGNAGTMPKDRLNSRPYAKKIQNGGFVERLGVTEDVH